MSSICRSVHTLNFRIISIPIRPYFSSTSAISSEPKRNIFQNEEVEKESAVYKHAMKFQKPSVMKWSTKLEKLENLVSFVGTVLWPVKVFIYGVANTEIDVNTSSSRFRITLCMKGDMASTCLQHLKPKDFIYVSGQLERFVDRNSVERYKVIVKELNYVVQRGEVSASPKGYRPEYSGESHMEKRRTRLHLWQLFFANPQEWWDNRNDKRNPRSPDFKHKDTGEALWQSPDDPPWIAAQLKLQDSKMSQYRYRRSQYSDARPGLSKWSPDDLV